MINYSQVNEPLRTVLRESASSFREIATRLNGNHGTIILEFFEGGLKKGKNIAEEALEYKKEKPTTRITG